MESQRLAKILRRLNREFGSSDIINQLEQYRIEKNFSDINSLFDSFASRFGLVIKCVPVIDEYRDLIGYEPTVEFCADNAFGVEPKNVAYPICRTLESCQEQLAISLIKELSEVVVS